MRHEIFLRILCAVLLILNQKSTLAQDNAVSLPPGDASIVVIFSHFAEISVRNILGSIRVSTETASWERGNTVVVFENGHAGQNPDTLTYSGSRWLPFNVHPMHKEDSVYKITRHGSTMEMVLTWQNNGIEPMALVRNSTVGAGIAYIRKSRGSDLHLPIAWRLTDIQNNPSATVQILYGMTPLPPKDVFMENFIFQLNITVAEFATMSESFQQVIADSYNVSMDQIEITNVTAVDSSGVTMLIHLQIKFFTVASSQAAVLLSDINDRLEIQGFPSATIVMPPGMTPPPPQNVFTEYFIFQLPITVAEFATMSESFQQVIADSYDVSMEQIEITSVTAVNPPAARRLLANLIEVRLQIDFFTDASSRAPVSLSDINDLLQERGFPIATIVMPSTPPLTCTFDYCPCGEPDYE